MNKIIWTTKAHKQLGKLTEKDSLRVASAVKKMENTWPQTLGVKKLVGRDEYRLRVGDFRVIFTVSPTGEVTILTVLKVSKRNENTYKH